MRKKIDWKSSNWANADDLASKIDWEGGLLEFVCNYNGEAGLPEPLKSAAKKLKNAADEAEKVFSDAGALL